MRLSKFNLTAMTSSKVGLQFSLTGDFTWPWGSFLNLLIGSPIDTQGTSTKLRKYVYLSGKFAKKNHLCMKIGAWQRLPCIISLTAAMVLMGVSVGKLGRNLLSWGNAVKSLFQAPQF